MSPAEQRLQFVRRQRRYQRIGVSMDQQPVAADAPVDVGTRSDRSWSGWPPMRGVTGLLGALHSSWHSRVDVFPYRHTMAVMARAATTSDVFNAIAEPQRRDI